MIAVLGIMGLVLAAILILAGFAEGKASEASSVVSPSVPSVPTIDSLISKYGYRFGVDTALIKAHIMTESSGDPNAVNPSDPSYGLMGITPRLAQDYGFVKDWRMPTDAEIAKLKDPAINIEIGTRFLSYLHGKYEFEIATQMYNCGEHGYNVNGVRVPAYLSRVRRYYDEFRSA